MMLSSEEDRRLFVTCLTILTSGKLLYQTVDITPVVEDNLPDNYTVAKEDVTAYITNNKHLLEGSIKRFKVLEPHIAKKSRSYDKLIRFTFPLTIHKDKQGYDIAQVALCA